MALAKRPGDILQNKRNVNPSLDPYTEARAEDFDEVSTILNDHADKLDAMVQPTKFYGYHTSLENLIAAHPTAVEDGWATIIPTSGNPPYTATYTNGEWIASVSKAPIQYYTTQTALLSTTGQEGIIYVVKDQKLLYLWYDNKFNAFGKDGANGASAYEVAVALGYSGTDEEWVASLQGLDNYQLWLQNGNTGTYEDFFEASRGPRGYDGDPGAGFENIPAVAGQIPVTVGDGTLIWEVKPTGGGGSNINRYLTIAAMLADQANQADASVQYVSDASADPTVDAGYAYYEYKGTTAGTLTDYRKLSEEESMDVDPGGLDIRMANLVADLSTAEKDAIKTKLGISESASQGKVLDFNGADQYEPNTYFNFILSNAKGSTINYDIPSGVVTHSGNNFYCIISETAQNYMVLSAYQWMCIGKTSDGSDILVSTKTTEIGVIKYVSPTGALSAASGFLFPNTPISSDARIKVAATETEVIISYSLNEGVTFTEWGRALKTAFSKSYSSAQFGWLNLIASPTLYDQESKPTTLISQDGYTVESSSMEIADAILEGDRIPIFNNNRDAGIALVDIKTISNPAWTIGKTALLYGDSITNEFSATAGAYTNRVKDKLGLSTVIKKGYSGAAIGNAGVNGTLANNVYLDEIVAAMPDLIIFLAGTNDFGNGDGVIVGASNSTTITETVGGMRYIIRYLQKRLPNSCLIFCTPTPRSTPSQTTPNVNGYILKDYVDALIEVCGDYSVPVLDLFRKSGIGFQDVESSQIFLNEGLHLTEAGYERITALQSNFIKTLR